MNTLYKIDLFDFALENGVVKRWMPLYYQRFGQAVGTAPVVLVNHALTGNSQVTGENGWWKSLIGPGAVIDTEYYTVIAFNIPGNGFDENPDNLIHNYKDFTTKDIAKIFWEGLEHLDVRELFAVIGGSLGGGIAWEMAFIEPLRIKNLIPVATDWKATDWLIANVLVQDKILNNSENPIHDARLHAMLLYRTPVSINRKFNRGVDAVREEYLVEGWLQHHGEKLKNRFQLSSYKLMNHLLKTIGDETNCGTFLRFGKETNATIHLVAVDSDYFFTADQNRETYEILKRVNNNVYYHEIQSVHGHDAFLIEFEQLNTILRNIFITTKQRTQ